MGHPAELRDPREEWNPLSQKKPLFYAKSSKISACCRDKIKTRLHSPIGRIPRLSQ
jgi:hypothetical protein